ncbi:MAG: diaminopimelate epimerase [Pyrinomonadaceae bacterium]
MPISFCKFHGFGNDYIVIEKDQIGRETDVSDLAIAICNRHTGAGSDGIAVLEKLDGGRADYFCEIVNPDGSIAGFSGNGTRCASAYLYYNAIWKAPDLRLETRSGVKKFTLIERESEVLFWFEAEIGKPKFSSEEIPVAAERPLEDVISRKIPVGDQTVEISAINVGNPVACIFVDDFDFDWRALGKALEVHPAFPEKANIVFVKVLDRENIELRIWERGAGETPASGTCATGAAILCAYTDRTDRAVSVITEGGTTEIFWRKDDEMLITGRADLAYSGEWPA